ncbi:putative arabinose-binding protein precursor [Microbacterium hydrocarbonoxydans]|uniref:Putative arabinose-binding protein n=1 Tax=Microbacterium hydrocarbonoxydans TaxID=273678 RepID=A0A0M2HNM5_9MICO|nr:sugar ABC transporter substrate-binding protein [Microbacterium hydrocarbonoxydans]KJL48291.1 putative arabinose-binding protein precursor [Microbacterium hydrocarbonoxydans]
MRIHRPIAVLVTGLTIAGLAGCSGSGESADGPIELEYWAWTAQSQAVVDQWNKENPDIQVKYTDAGGGTDSSTKLLTATRAGNAPDVALVEYTTLPALVVADVPTEITDYVDDIQDAFTEGTWAQTTFDGAVYGIPQDVGPMATIYRADRFAELGVTPPTTWAEFRTAAEAIKAADPASVIAALPPTEFGFWAGVATQAGGRWWSSEGDEWTVGIADEASLEVADFFEKLVDDGLISTDPLLTPEYNAALNAGTMLSWPSAVWAPGVIENVAADTSGGWEMSPLPRWDEEDPAVPYQGGSALVVTTSSDHPEEAAKFASWLNASEEGNGLLVSEQSLFPAAIVGQEMAQSNDPPALMPQQTDFYDLAAEIAGETIPVMWGPNVNLARTVFTDELQKAIDNGTPWRDAFIATQKAVVDDMVKSGFKVTND